MNFYFAMKLLAEQHIFLKPSLPTDLPYSVLNQFKEGNSNYFLFNPREAIPSAASHSAKENM